MSKFTEYVLPEFVFLDGNSHEGDKLEGRTVMQHVRSATILEVIDLSELLAHSFTQPTYEFEYLNVAGLTEKHMFVVHFSLMIDSPFTEVMPDNKVMDEIFEACKKWYCDYLAWEDRNIGNNSKVKHN